jgi:hypothetical protein
VPATISNAAGTKGTATGVAVGATNIGCYYDDGVAARVTATPVALAVTNPVLVSIAVTPAAPTIAATFTQQFTATGTYSDASTANITADPLLTWASSTVATATISNAVGSKGLATGVAAGTTNITATVGTVVGTTTLRVSSATLVTITVAPATATVQRGLTQQYTAQGTFSDGSTMVLTTMVTWAASGGTGVSISNAAGSNGLVSASSTATLGPWAITATRGTIVGTAGLTVVAARQLCSIDVTINQNATIRVGLTAQATAFGNYSDDACGSTPTALRQNITTTVTWFTTAAGVATISNATGSQGLITGVAGGSSNITATLSGVMSGATTVYVTVCPFATTLVVAPVAGGSANIPQGMTQQFVATASYTTGTGCTSSPPTVMYDVTEIATWGSTNAANATVSNAAGTRGLVTASSTPTGSPATSNITATYTAASGQATVTIVTACAQTITVSPATITLPNGGVTRQFTAMAHMSNGTDIDYTNFVNWSYAPTSTPPAVISDASGTKGLLTTQSSVTGTTTVTATATSYCGSTAPTATATVTVNNATLTAISVAPATATIVRGASGHIHLTATGTFSDTSTHDVTQSAVWLSSNTGVASVDDSVGTKGYVVGLADGNAIMTASFQSRSATSNITVNSVTVTDITIAVQSSFGCTTTGGEFPVGINVPLVATATYSDGTSGPVTTTATWASGSTANVTVNASGVARTVAGGAANITASIGSVTSNILPVLVSATPVLSGITVAPASTWSLRIGQTQDFTAQGTYSTISGTCPLTTTVTWVSDQPTRLSIDALGHALARAGGAVTVTASIGAVPGTSSGTVETDCISGIQVVPATATIANGQTVVLTAQAVYTSGTTPALSSGVGWSETSDAIDFNPTPTGGSATVEGHAATGGTPAVVTANYTPSAGACTGTTLPFDATAAITVTAPVLSSVVVTCNENSWGTSGAGIPVGVNSQCTATGVYSDTTTQNLTASATWSSGTTGVATVSDTSPTKGLATSVAAGNSMISATVGTMSGSAVLHVLAATLSSITVSGVSSFPVGLTYPFGASGAYTLSGATNSYPITEFATWTSSDASRATVSNTAGTKGRVSSVASGTANITAAYQGRTGLFAVTVSAETLTAITVSPAAASSPTVSVGETLEFHASGLYSDGYSDDITDFVTWTTADATRVTIAATGIATGVAVTATPVIITATRGTRSGTSQLAVTTRCIRSIDLTPSTVSVPVDVPVVFTVTALYSDGASVNVTGLSGTSLTSSAAGWMGDPQAGSSVTYPGYTYSMDGGTPPGSVTITAAVSSGWCTSVTPSPDTSAVTITAATLNGITVSPASGTVPDGLTTDFTASGTYSDSSSHNITQRVTWGTGNAAVATINNTLNGRNAGRVTGESVGTTSVTATQDTRSGSATVTVGSGVLESIRVYGLVTLSSCDTTFPGAWTETAGFAHPFGGYTTRVRAMGRYTGSSTDVDITESVNWTSSDATRAAVSAVAGSRGLVTTGTGTGTVTITATLGTPSDTITLNVVNATLAAVFINPSGPDPVNVALGNTSQLTLQGRFGTTDRYCITEQGTYSSGTTSVATVSNAAGTRGLVSSVATGSAVVTATVGTISDTIPVTVATPTLSYIEVLPATLSMSRGATAQFRAWGHYSDLSTNDITANTDTTWTVVNSGSCTVGVDTGTNRGLVSAGSTACGTPGARIEACDAGGICAHDGTDRRATVTVP